MLTLNRADSVRDGVAAVLLVLGLLLPWNISVGLGISGTPGWLFAILVLVTLALTAAASTRLGGAVTRLRPVLAAPHLVLVAAFVVFALIGALRSGGTADIPPGVGPGVWFGAAGAVLATRPSERYGARVCAVLAVLALVLGGAASVVNLYWRTRFVLPAIGDPDIGGPSLATAVTAVLYAVVAIIPLLITYRWLRSEKRAARWATVGLGVSVLTAGFFVWVLPVGRDLDAFHGIAQDTGTTGVGFEGYLAWVVAAAILAPATLKTGGTPEAALDQRQAIRKALLLIAAWCGGTAILRIADVLMSAVLDLPAPPYNSTALMAFDLIAVVLALWLFVNAPVRVAPSRSVVALTAGLFAFAVGRVIVGVALVPRVQPLDPNPDNAVFGNTLAQQITSTFDVALAVLALLILAVTVKAARPTSRPAEAPAPTQAPTPAAVSAAQAVVESAPEPIGAPQIFRPTPTAEAVPAEPEPGQNPIAAALLQSTQKFAAQTGDEPSED